MKFLEYEISSGRIVSEITSSEEPEVSSGFALLAIDDNEQINLSMYSVRNGALVKTSETNQERGRAKGMFWGAHQRFFNQIITALQTPATIKDIEKQLEAGHSVVIQLTNTYEAEMRSAPDIGR